MSRDDKKWRDANTIATQAARIAELEAALSDLREDTQDFNYDCGDTLENCPVLLADWFRESLSAGEQEDEERMTDLFGRTGRDILTGFEGVVYGRSTYMTGCDQLLMIPKVSDPNDLKEGHWFDIDRITIQESARVSVPNKSGNPGGPSRGAPKK